MKHSIQERAIEILGAVSAYSGALTVSSLLFTLTANPDGSSEWKVSLEIVLLAVWYVLVASLLIAAHPRPNRRVFLLLGLVVSAAQIIPSQGWLDPTLDVATWAIEWLKIYMAYWLVIPIFLLAGYSAERLKAGASGT